MFFFKIFFLSILKIIRERSNKLQRIIHFLNENNDIHNKSEEMKIIIDLIKDLTKSVEYISKIEMDVIYYFFEIFKISPSLA